MSNKDTEIEEKVKVQEEEIKTSSSCIDRLDVQNKLLMEQLDGDWVEKSHLDEAKKALDNQGKKATELQTQLVGAQNANESKASVHVLTLEWKKKELAQELAQLKTKEAEDLKCLSELQKEKDALQMEIALLKSLNEVLNEEIKVLKVLKCTLEQRNAEYKSEIEALKKRTRGSPSLEPEASIAQLYGATRRGTRRVLSKVNLVSAVYQVKQKYGLKDPIEEADSSYTTDSKSDKHPKFCLSIGQKPKRSFSYIIKTKDSTQKGKGKEHVDASSASSDSDNVFSDNDMESKAQTNQSNKLVRSQLREMLNVLQNNNSLRCPGIKTTDSSQLEKFLNDPDKYGPGLHCTYLYTSGRNIDKLK
ncbi:hypothetical protein GYMLUDRAFT_245667 [Collybiopsis luxurians FD-317 M1]|uniref:Uncharacterized protein n=1 Tax=Collybiopsis luxurians FD-317 M1 TaxID=944289 RepID=A0A0D0CT35_9AGAR|nr:hypothetical protein GYMLUDRAFT_245667 [Collybiopsis luxurians FD-317 M1]